MIVSSLSFEMILLLSNRIFLNICAFQVIFSASSVSMSIIKRSAWRLPSDKEKPTMFWPISVVVFLALTGLTRALPPESEIELLEDLIEQGDQLQTISKRDLEFNQYVPAYRLRGEPSCEELRAMWRLSKREARRATSTNSLPRSRPYSYGRIFAFAPNGHQRQFVYGEPRNFASHKSVSFSPIKGSFDRLRGMLGMGVGRPGSFQKVRTLVASQRLPGESSKGKMEELRGIVLGNAKSTPQDEEESPTPLRSAEIYQPVRRTPSVRYDLQSDASDSKEGFIGPLMPGYGAPLPSDWRARAWRLQHIYN
ncbi:hypothetical protein Avbf_01255 [Armadillidium vulgare]|nr:hypothetical protein Avbf_01255 [Armadillidium vulgare]